MSCGAIECVLFGHVSVSQEVEYWTLHLVGSVATSTRVWGSNPEDAGVEPEINSWWCMDESPTKSTEHIVRNMKKK